MVCSGIPGFLPRQDRLAGCHSCLIYNLDLLFGFDEAPDEMFTVDAYKVAEQVVRDYVKTAICCGTPEKESNCSAGRCGQ